MSNITLPTVHLNGTSAEMLFRDYFAAAEAVFAAKEAIAKIEFHSRDYYPVPGSWEKARKEHRARFDKLEEVRKELDEIAAHVYKFKK